MKSRKVIITVFLLSIVSGLFLFTNREDRGFQTWELHLNEGFSVPKVDQESENPAKRFEQEFKQLRNPRSNRIPPFIKLKEQEFLRNYNETMAAIRQQTEYVSEAVQTEASAFVNRGPYNIGGRTRALGIDVANEDIIIAGGISGGIWRTTDKGQTWTRTSGLQQHPSVSALIQDKRTGKTNNWYYGTGERRYNSASADGAFYLGNGIYKSTDNGESWELISTTASPGTSDTDVITAANNFSLVDELAIDFSNTGQDEIYASGLGRVWRTDDDFQSWSTVLGRDNDASNMADVVVNSQGVVFASIGNSFDNGTGAQEGVWRSSNGVNWTNITPSTGLESSYLRLELAVDPSDDSKLWVLGDESLLLWDDNTQLWTNKSAQLNLPAGDRDSREDFETQVYYNQTIAVHPNSSDVVLIGGTNLYRSDNAFTTSGQSQIGGYDPDFAGTEQFWEYPDHHPDIHSLDFFASNQNHAVVGSDGGVHLTENLLATGSNAVNWQSLNNGYLSTQFYHADMNGTNYGDPLILGGLQDNGSWIQLTDQPTEPWLEIGGGDGAWAAYTYNAVYVSSQYGFIYRHPIVNNTIVNGIDISPLTNGNEEAFLFTNPFEYNMVNQDQIVVGASGKAFFTTDVRENPGPGEWFEISSDDLELDQFFVTAMGFSTQPEGVLYMGTEVGTVLRVDNTHDISGDVQATDLPFGEMPEGYIGSVTVNPADAEHVIVTFTNYEVISIWESTDGGQNWSSISGNLEENADGSGAGPSVRSFAIMPDGQGGNYYFAGTSVGLFMTQNLDGDNTVWTQQSADGIGNVVVSWIRVRPVEGLVLVSTHGNGVFTGTYEVGINPLVNYSYDSNTEEYFLRANQSYSQDRPMAYRWVKDGQEIQGANEATFTPTQSGDYQVRLFFTETESALSNTITVTTTNANAPGIASIARFDPQNQATANTSVIFEVQFTEDVVNVDATDFETTGNATGTISNVEQLTATNYRVTVSDITGGGSLGLGVVNTSDIENSEGVAFNGTIGSAETYTITDGDVPTAAITRLDPSTEVTDQNEVSFQVTFSERIVNFGVSDLTFSAGSVAANFGNIRQITAGLTYEVNIIEIDEDGMLGITFANTQDVEDESGNPFAGELTANETFTIENVITSIDEQYLGGNNKIIVDRNPSNGVFYLAFPDSFVGDFELGVLSVSGRMITQESIKGYASNQQFKLDLSKEADGLFVVRARKEDQELTIKLIKQNN